MVIPKTGRMIASQRAEKNKALMRQTRRLFLLMEVPAAAQYLDAPQQGTPSLLITDHPAHPDPAFGEFAWYSISASYSGSVGAARTLHEQCIDGQAWWPDRQDHRDGVLLEFLPMRWSSEAHGQARLLTVASACALRVSHLTQYCERTTRSRDLALDVNSRSLPSQRGHNPQLNLMRRKKDSTMQILPFVCVISKGRFA